MKGLNPESTNKLLIIRDKKLFAIQNEPRRPSQSCANARCEVQMKTGDEFSNFHLTRTWSPSQEITH